MTIHNQMLIPIASQKLRDAAATLLCTVGKDPADPETERHVMGAEELASKVIAVLAAARNEPIANTLDRVRSQITDAADRLANPTELCEEHQHQAARPGLSLVRQDNDEQE